MAIRLHLEAVSARRDFQLAERRGSQEHTVQAHRCRHLGTDREGHDSGQLFQGERERLLPGGGNLDARVQRPVAGLARLDAIAAGKQQQAIPHLDARQYSVDAQALGCRCHLHRYRRREEDESRRQDQGEEQRQRHPGHDAPASGTLRPGRNRTRSGRSAGTGRWRRR